MKLRGGASVKVYDVNKSNWCVDGSHDRCHGERVCNCLCHREYRIGDFEPSIRWAFTKNDHVHGHMQKGHGVVRGRTRTECGIWGRAAVSVEGWQNFPVCKRCLKATEKYA